MKRVTIQDKRDENLVMIDDEFIGTIEVVEKGNCSTGTFMHQDYLIVTTKDGRQFWVDEYPKSDGTNNPLLPADLMWVSA